MLSLNGNVSLGALPSDEKPKEDNVVNKKGLVNFFESPHFDFNGKFKPWSIQLSGLRPTKQFFFQRKLKSNGQFIETKSNSTFSSFWQTFNGLFVAGPQFMATLKNQFHFKHQKQYFSGQKWKQDCNIKMLALLLIPCLRCSQNIQLFLYPS